VGSRLTSTRRVGRPPRVAGEKRGIARASEAELQDSSRPSIRPVSRRSDAVQHRPPETGDEDLTAEARACVDRLKAFREVTAAQPTRASAVDARPPSRGESLYFSS